MIDQCIDAVGVGEELQYVHFRIDVVLGQIYARDHVDLVDRFGRQMKNVRERSDNCVIDAQHDDHGEEGGRTARHGRDALFVVELLDLFVLLLFVIRVLFSDFFLFCLQARVSRHTLLLFDRRGEEDDPENQGKYNDGQTEILEYPEYCP